MCVNAGDRPPPRQPPGWRKEDRSHDRHREGSSTELLANCAFSRPHLLRLRTPNVNRSYLTSGSAWPPSELWAEPHAEGPPRAILLGFQSSLPVEGRLGQRLPCRRAGAPIPGLSFSRRGCGTQRSSVPSGPDVVGKSFIHAGPLEQPLGALGLCQASDIFTGRQDSSKA